jgi:hypothetical protein
MDTIRTFLLLNLHHSSIVDRHPILSIVTDFFQLLLNISLSAWLSNLDKTLFTHNAIIKKIIPVKIKTLLIPKKAARVAPVIGPSPIPRDDIPLTSP